MHRKVVVLWKLARWLGDILAYSVCDYSHGR